MVIYMNNLISNIKNIFSNNPDLIIRKIKYKYQNIYVIYLETISSSDKINDYILKNLNYFIGNNNLKKLNSILPSPNIINIKEYKEIEFYLTNGFCLVINNKEILAIEVRADINRSISTPDIEQSLFGPKDSFVENYQINLGLIKRRIKSSNLKTKEINIGKHTNTKVGIIYMNNIANISNVNYIINKLSKINVDGIIDSSELAQYLIENKTVFPTITSTERPDKVSKSLLEGKIIVLVDTSCFALITPTFLADFINPTIDNYIKNSSFSPLKILRTICFFITIIFPGYYISLINYNQESLPTSLLLKFSSQRIDVPFPSIVEAMIMLFICEMLRESDLRFPSSYSSAVSILGALILGEAAVTAGIVSPIMIIVIAFTFITSLMFVEPEMINAIRHFRFIFLLLASIYGMYGIIISLIYFFIHICSLKTLGMPYFYPIAPFNNYFFKKLFIKSDLHNDTKRSKLLSNKNVIKQRKDLL